MGRRMATNTVSMGKPNYQILHLFKKNNSLEFYLSRISTESFNLSEKFTQFGHKWSLDGDEQWCELVRNT